MMALRQGAKALVAPALLLGLLEWYARVHGAGSDSLAPPSAAAAALVRVASDLGSQGLVRATAFTLGCAGLGLASGAVLGIVLGLVLGFVRQAASAGFLVIEILRPIPSVALIPLTMLIFGFGYRMELSVVAFATFWPILILTQAAVRQVGPRFHDVARALGLGPFDWAWKIILPAILPRLFVALRLGVAIALVVAVTVEIAANPSGMGYALIIAQQTLAPDLMLAWLFWVGVTGFVVNAMALKLQKMVARRLGATDLEETHL